MLYFEFDLSGDEVFSLYFFPFCDGDDIKTRSEAAPSPFPVYPRTKGRKTRGGWRERREKKRFE